MAFPYCNLTQEEDVGLEGVPEVPRRQDCFSSSSRSDGAILSFNGGVMEQEIPRRDLSTRSPNVESPIGFKSPSSLSAWLSKMPTPQRDVYMFAIWSDSRNFKSVNNVSATSATSCCLTFVIPGTIATPPTVKPYHHHKPNYNSGKHSSVGKDASTFNIKQAAKVASHRETHNLIDAFMKTGNLEQRRHSLCKFLIHKSIIKDT